MGLEPHSPDEMVPQIKVKVNVLFIVFIVFAVDNSQPRLCLQVSADMIGDARPPSIT